MTNEYLGTATYSPDDNKLRLYPDHRLSAEDYARVKAAGFRWAPKQELFVAPMWTPSREDLLVVMCGEIGDEDTSLVDRAEERAERFDEYSAKRKAEAKATHEATEQLAQSIPLGQPILVGHHSERRARKDADKIRNGTAKALKMWETSRYWTARAAGALIHAKYKELPDVRARRIKKIEKDLRKVDKQTEEANTWVKAWSAENLTLDQARKLSGYDSCYTKPNENGEREQVYCLLREDEDKPPKITAAEAAAISIAAHKNANQWRERWRAHYQNRIAYERAMLDEQGATTSDTYDFQPGGRVKTSAGEFSILRVNRFEGKAVSLTIDRDGYAWERKVELANVLSYDPPDERSAAAAKAKKKKPPLCNYPGEGFAHITKADWKRIRSGWSDSSGVHMVEPTETHGRHRIRKASRRQVEPDSTADYWKRVPVYLTDQKRVDPPVATSEPPQAPTLRDPLAPRHADHSAAYVGTGRRQEDDTFGEILRGNKEAANKMEVRAVSTPSFFPTPPDLARKMVRWAGETAGKRVLEPSAGSGNLIKAIQGYATGADNVRVVAVEHAPTLAESLRETRRMTLYANDRNFEIHCKDFMECNGDLGQFGMVIMNPPFERGQDVDHIRHAYGYLKPGGVLVSVVCEGPFFRSDRKSTEFREWLGSVGAEVEKLPQGAFKESGTSVRARLIRIERGFGDPPRGDAL